MKAGSRTIKLQTKMVGLFIAIFVFSSVIGFWGIKDFLFISEEFSTVTEETLPVIKIYEDLRFAAIRLVSSTNEFALIASQKKSSGASDDEQEKTEMELINTAKDVYSNTIQTYEKYVDISFPEEKVHLQSLKESGQKLIDISDLMLDEKTSEASEIELLELKEQFEEAESSFLALLDDMLRDEMDELEARKKTVNDTLSGGIYALIAACGLVFVFTVISGALTSKLIVRPITDLRNAAIEIGKGNLNTRVNIKLNDEIGELSRSFNAMAENLKASRDEAMLSRKSFQEQSEFLTHVVNSIPYPFFVVNITDFSVRMVNSSASSFKEWDKVKCFEMAEKMDIPCVGSEHTCSLELVRLTKKPFVTECLHHDKNHEAKYYEIHAYPVFDDKGSITEIIEYSIDITENKRAEIELQKSADKLRQSNYELQNFLFIASHDLREPLRKVMVFGDRLRIKYAQFIDDQGKNYIEKMLTATRRMHALIDSLHIYTRITTEARPFVPVNLTDVMQQALADMKEYISQTGALVEIKGLPILEADPAQIRQLFQNLISNALKFRKNDVKPVIRIEGSLINHESASLKESYQITVEDNGIGFENKYAERIFGVFQRLHGKNEYEGTGIGLSICRKIVERHGGNISARSIPGEGTTFIVTLPTQHLN